MTQVLIGVDDIAKMCRVPASSVKQYRKRMGMPEPVVALHRQPHLFDKVEVEQWLKSNDFMALYREHQKASRAKHLAKIKSLGYLEQDHRNQPQRMKKDHTFPKPANTLAARFLRGEFFGSKLHTVGPNTPKHGHIVTVGIVI